MPKQELLGGWALVTGAGARVGAAIVDELAHAGCHVMVHHCANESGARDVAERVRKAGRKSVVLQADLCDREALRSMACRVIDVAGGSLAVLVHSAACFERVVPSSLDSDSWDRAMALNVTAPYLLTLALVEALKQARGSVVAISCVSAIKPWRNYVPYATSKAALWHTVKGLAVALAPDVRVNAVAPGVVMLPDDADPGTEQQLVRRIPLRRIGEPGDVARAVRFLAENDYVTGQMIAVDGGRSLE